MWADSKTRKSKIVTFVLITYSLLLFLVGSAFVHNFTVQFYALAATSYDVWINGSKTQSETLTASGYVVRELFLPPGLAAPSQHYLYFNYTDVCDARNYTATIYLDQIVAGVSHRVSVALFVAYLT